MGKVFKITEEVYNAYIKGEDVFNYGKVNEIKNIASQSNITVASLEDFKHIVSKLGINDNNVEQYVGKFCFIEIGSSLSRLRAEVPHIPSVNDENGKPYNADDLYSKGQWYFSNEHKNVLKLEFDDNQKFDNKLPKGNGFDGKTPATAVKLSSSENIYGKEGFRFYYTNGADFTNEIAQRLKKFVDYNLSLSPDVKFVIHCKQGKSRSAAIGSYVAKKIGQFTDTFLSEYDKDGESQFNIGMSKKKQPKYPHKNVMTKMGEIEGWSNPKKDTKEQWFYNTLVNHPETGYNVKKMQQESVNEDVYIDALNNKRNKNVANLTYKKSSGGYNKGNKNSFDMLKTNLMDNTSNNNTYEVPLKGGLMSFNITDINGTEVMHYFKKKFDKEQAKIKMGDTEYDLEMDDAEFRYFMQTFIKKVSTVVEYQTNVFKQNNKDLTFSGVSIYPVPSSSNFNKCMAERISKNRHMIAGLPVQIISSDVLKKNTKNLTKDEDFINKNSDYYNSERWKSGGNGGTHLQAVNNDLNRLSRLEDVEKAINKANEYTKIENRMQTGSLLKQLNYVQARISNPEKYGEVSEKAVIKLRDLYVEYVNAVSEIRKASTYYDEILQKNHTPFLKNVASAIKYSKGPSIEGRTERILSILKQYGLSRGLPANKEDICMWRPVNFQIKYFGNDTRMALKNYFQPNNNSEYVKNETERAENNIVVVFDDNVSGGATLSDICMQIQNLGLKYIIPITFGRMRTSYNQGTYNVINKPKNGFNY